MLLQQREHYTIVRCVRSFVIIVTIGRTHGNEGIRASLTWSISLHVKIKMVIEINLSVSLVDSCNKIQPVATALEELTATA
jgi:hypothetical protein